MPTKTLPTNLLEAIRYFSDVNVATEFVASLRWRNGWKCPICEGTEYSYLTTRRLWKCKSCKRQTSVKVGTIFEDSPIPLDKWLASIWLIANSKNGISSHELGRAIGLTQKSAWFVLQRIRLAMKTGTFESFDGTVEMDETYIGGKQTNMHAHDPKRTASVTGNKSCVVGAIERGGRVAAKVVPGATRNELEGHANDNVLQGSTLYTDSLRNYAKLADAYDYDSVNHSGGEYVRGDVHTNTIENFWSVLKRSLHGTYISVRPFHLFRYVDERVFAFNERHRDDLGRFVLVMGMVSGRRLTYAELTGKG